MQKQNESHCSNAQPSTSLVVPSTSQAATFLPPPVITGISHLCVWMLCAMAVTRGLLPGLLAICLGYLCTRLITRLTLPLSARTGVSNIRPGIAAALVIIGPVIVIGGVLAHAKGFTLSALREYPELLQHLSKTALDFKKLLPAGMAQSLPVDTQEIQVWLSDHLHNQARAIAMAGTEGLHAVLLAYVGMVIGSLIAVSHSSDSCGPFARALTVRACNFVESFKQIVAAQFWIAAFNATLTAVFLFVLMPAFEVHLPFPLALVSLTFMAGLVPIVGNLLCNAVLALVGVSVSPAVGLACLCFLILIHKSEYVINARVVGRRTHTAAWELLAVMFAGEALFGVSGLVAAPLYYAYLKKELKDAGLI